MKVHVRMFTCGGPQFFRPMCLHLSRPKRIAIMIIEHIYAAQSNLKYFSFEVATMLLFRVQS
jgi:hypothetical protein